MHQDAAMLSCHGYGYLHKLYYTDPDLCTISCSSLNTSSAILALGGEGV